MIQLQQRIKPMVSYQLASNIDPTRTLTIRTKFVAVFHGQEGLVPAFDDPSGPDREFNGLATIIGRVIDNIFQ